MRTNASEPGREFQYMSRKSPKAKIANMTTFGIPAGSQDDAFRGERDARFLVLDAHAGNTRRTPIFGKLHLGEESQIRLRSPAAPPVPDRHGEESKLAVHACLPVDLHLVPVNGAHGDGIVGHCLERVHVVVCYQQYVVFLPHFIEAAHNKGHEVIWQEQVTRLENLVESTQATGHCASLTRDTCEGLVQHDEKVVPRRRALED